MWIYIGFFYITWSLRELWLDSYIDLVGHPILQPITSAIIKLMIWVFPVFVYLKRVENDEPLSFLRLRTNMKEGVKWGLWGSLGFFLYFIMLQYVIHGNGINLNFEFDEWFNGFILVGFTEEIVFRGLLLPTLMSSFKFWKANGITSLLFVFIHFPVWILEGSFQFPHILNLIVQIFILSLIFGFIYKKSRSLWSVIIIHSMYDLFILIFT